MANKILKEADYLRLVVNIFHISNLEFEKIQALYDYTVHYFRDNRIDATYIYKLSTDLLIVDEPEPNSKYASNEVNKLFTPIEIKLFKVLLFDTVQRGYYS